MFVITGARYTGVLFHTLYYYWAEEYRSLYRGVRYTGVFVVTGARYTGVLFHTLYYYWAEEYRSLYRGVRYNGGSLYRGSFPYVVLLLS